MRRSALFAIAATLLGAAGCSLVAGLSGTYVSGATDGGALATVDAQVDGGPGASDGASGDGPGYGGDALPDAPEGGNSFSCNQGTFGDPPMVAAVGTGPVFCIDSTEVTEADYALFITAAGGLKQADPCLWNTNFDPTQNGTGECQGYDFTGANKPVVCVDWCDAKAYCEMAGKRLCGKVGSGGLAVPGDLNDPTKDQWFSACSGGDSKRTYPYGATYAPGQCVESAAASADVKSHLGCQGTAPGLFDMSGNVSEWQDACDTAGSSADGQNCKVRGGDFSAAPADKSLHCNEVGPQEQRKFTSRRVGFRCCK